MKGLLDQKIAAVQQAEAECNRQRDDADNVWTHLKAEIRRTATPGRIVVSGLVLGFASGMTTAKAAGAASGKLLAGPVFSMLLETVLPAALAGFTALYAEADQNDENQDSLDGEQAESDEPTPAAEPAEDEAPEAPINPRARRRPRADSAA